MKQIFLTTVTLFFTYLPSTCFAANQFDQADAAIEKFGGAIIGVIFIIFLTWKFFKKKK